MPGPQQVAQQDDFAELADLGQLHGVVWAVRVTAGEGEAGGGRVADEEWRDDQVQLIGQARGEKLGREVASAFEQYSGQPPFG